MTDEELKEYEKEKERAREEKMRLERIMQQQKWLLNIRRPQKFGEQK